METLTGQACHVGVGYATQADAFQAGREAAQMAKGGLPEGPVNLVLVFARPDIHFKDFVEGARLIAGEEGLVAVPVPNVAVSDFPSMGLGVVALIQSGGARLATAATPLHPGLPWATTTELFTQLRHARGNAIHQFSHRGLLFFHGSEPFDAAVIAAETGVEPWVVGAAASCGRTAPIICKSSVLERGMAVVECLSEKRWGIGTVGFEAFRGRSAIEPEVVKSALRDALSQLEDASPAAVMLVRSVAAAKDQAELTALVKVAADVLPHTPIIAMDTERHFARAESRGLFASNQEALTAFVIPQ